MSYQNRYSSDKNQVKRTLQIQIDFVKQNLEALRKADKKGTFEPKFLSIASAFERGEELSPAQKSVIEGAYEKVFAGAGYESVGLHIDKKRKGLRF